VNESDFARRSKLLNATGRLLLVRSDGRQRRVAEFLESEIKRILAQVETIS
jgi:hypothetical protein